MNFTSAQISAAIGSYLWPFFRIAAVIAVAPIFGARTVPVRIRLGLALVLTLIVAPVLPPAPALDPISPLGLLVTVQQILIGSAMGFAILLVFSAFVLGGQVFAMQMGLGFASMVDPQRGVQVPMVSQFYVLFATLVFLSLNGHLILIQVVADSFRSMPVAPTGLTTIGLWTLVGWGKQMFAGAVLIALPAIATLMIVNLAFGVMTRAAPQLNIFAVGFPISMTVGFVVMMIMLPTAVPQLEHLVDNVFAMVRQLVGGP
jgi:flagellar biosynthetic protein FliR